MENRIKTQMVKLIDHGITLAVLLGTLCLFSYGCYAIWDANTVVSSSLPDKYQKYKPDKDFVSLDELQKVNSDVLGWIQIYGTNVDYPLVQGENNDKYLAKNALGEYSLSGAIFMDYRNDRSFKDFNHIIYGHHMEYHTMFGDVSEFKSKDFFQTHRYGKLCHDGQVWGIDFFAFLEVDAYSTFVYTPAITGENVKQAYLDDIYAAALHSRDISVTPGDRIILLSTCTTGLTNGRHILAGKLTEKVVGEQKEDTKSKSHPYIEVNREIVSIWILIAAIVITLIWVIAIKIRGIKRRERDYEKRIDV